MAATMTIEFLKLPNESLWVGTAGSCPRKDVQFGRLQGYHTMLVILEGAGSATIINSARKSHTQA